ncbi:uncharacterized protein F4822DRAFT_254714 [Hypoxylon trugodes]|uniref:uncharacterized protein n=1 Tax=Hypoxylon trugodes TaxID=326681 RepID=UPI0021A088A8|nr:uncharacterized protein F4822DRAFT_254714 [Hypoxylon trugodes]KAI1388734.1 hypothetical protein F4822DRAFT_254714 [Hypoxylon trugodes]
MTWADDNCSYTTEGSNYTFGSAHSVTETVDSGCSDATSVYHNADEEDVDHPPADPPAGWLPCEFVGMHCQLSFHASDVENWINHIITDHLSNQLPIRAICLFCDDYTFDSTANELNGDTYTNFWNRMMHIREHFLDGERICNIRPDFCMYEHLHDQNLIPEETYRMVMKYNELPYGHSQLKHIRPRTFVSPEELKRTEKSNRVLIDHTKEERSRKRSGKDRKNKEKGKTSRFVVVQQ